MKCISWKMFETGKATLFREGSVGGGFRRCGDDESWPVSMLDPRYGPSGDIVRNMSKHS